MKTSKKIYIKNVKSKKTGKYSIYLRVLHNGIKSEGLIEELDPVFESEITKWNQTYERFETILASHNDIISTINIRFKELKIIKKKELNTMSPKEIRDYILDRSIYKSTNLTNSLEDFLKKTIDPNVSMTKGTKKNYKKAFKHLNNFLNKKSLKGITLENFNAKHAYDFSIYLTSIMQNVSAHSILTNIRPFFEAQLDAEIIGKNPFKKVKIKYRQKTQTKIKEHNLITIKNLDLENYKALELHKDIFLCLCYTGVSYIDFFKIKRKNLLKIKGKLFLDSTRVKTDIIIQQFLTDELIKIMDKYKEHPEVQINDTLVPKRSLNKLNIHLKLLGVKIDFKHPLTTYHARRFFRQTCSKAKISDIVVKDTLMGHSTFASIDGVYLDVEEELLLDANQKLNNYYKQLYYEK